MYYCGIEKPGSNFFLPTKAGKRKYAYEIELLKKFTTKPRKIDFFCIIKITKSAEADPETILEVLKTNPWPSRKKVFWVPRYPNISAPTTELLGENRKFLLMQHAKY